MTLIRSHGGSAWPKPPWASLMSCSTLGKLAMDNGVSPDFPDKYGFPISIALCGLPVLGMKSFTDLRAAAATCAGSWIAFKPGGPFAWMVGWAMYSDDDGSTVPLPLPMRWGFSGAYPVAGLPVDPTGGP